MRRRAIAGLTAAGAAVALVVGISIAWPGLDAQETPEVDTSLWALQTDGLRYARVNTTVGELDTVRSVNNPSQVVQSAAGAFLFSDSNSKLTRIDEALPVDLDEEALEAAASTPASTTDVVTAGDFVAYRTDTGTVYAGRLSSGASTQLDPFPAEDGEDTTQYTADAIAVDAAGRLFAYSATDGAVLRYDIDTGEVRGTDAVSADIAIPALTAAGDRWALVDTEDGRVWLRGTEAPIDSGLIGLVAGAPDPDGQTVYVASESGLVGIPVDGGTPVAEVDRGATVIGTPAAPIVHDGQVFAAWLGSNDSGGTLWTRDGEQPLDYAGESIGEQRRPVFTATAQAVILNDTRSGWVWTVPDGALVASSQDWTLDDRTDPATVQSEEQLSVVIDPKPPIAEPDSFGVRAGRLATLPVLMNDHDPNEDVLSIDPASVTGLDPGFGAVSITDDGQRLAVQVAPGATGSATFQYAVSDGTAVDGLLSAPTTVTLTVSEGDAAPEWCGVEGCLVPWPAPEVELGGTVTVPVLPGWVDPDGDPLLLLSVENSSGIGTVAATPSGEVVYQHSDDGSGAEQVIELQVTVADTTGQTSTRPLQVRVSPTPALQVQSFAVVDTVGTGLTVDVAPHVTGTAGTLSVSAVRVLDDAAATATVVGGTTAFDFSASEPGTYRVGFTVTDSTSDATGTARITLLDADAPADLATSPVVAFVHPQQDATLDVFAAVSNPTRRVLLLSDVVATADEGATLSVDSVGQSDLRVSGTTASGASGRLGTVTYTVSDGTEDAGARITGEATVYLLPPAPELAPIAVDESIVVRAGAQIDIPVLDNDISPSGGRPVLNPASVESSTPDALAFASGSTLRYLAPTTPNDYEVEYSVYTTGSPGLSDTATVHIRVLDDTTNRPPLPDRLEGRVLSGGTTTIDFDGFGMDPDGDTVTLDRIVEQPESGAATISADGSAIVYSSVPGQSGQVSFRYRVVDTAGATGEGTVRIGVLDAEANPSPVTFTDYVQVQVGEDNTIRVNPLANDVDPTQGALALTEVRPDLAETFAEGEPNPEYARLAGQIVSLSDTEVVIAAGETPGTMSFLYDVASDSGNTGRGLIVVRVVRESVPDYPVVTDTVLSAENREDFASGVDVLDGKATWSGGDVADLTVSLWGAPDDVQVSGSEISGELPETTRLIPFAVTGMRGETEITTYAFLRVPGADDVALALRAGTTAQQVVELESTTFDMATLVAVPRGSTLEVSGDVQASGARADSTCVVDSGTRIRYSSGAGAPWTDACRVPVRLAGTEEWTSLSVPIAVTALDPQPELRAASLTVGPGETATYDLRTMTTWQLREDWSGIQYSVDYAGAAFTVSQSGSVLTIVGADAAVPGTENAAQIGVTSHNAVAPARLVLRVGAAPSTLPQGGSVTQQCSQASGSSCTITVVGASGEVNPLPRTPLEVVDVRPTGACVGVTFRVASTGSVAASWTADAPGATCTATFSVRDAQGRTTASERNGRILLDLQGYPRAAASVRQSAYGDGEVALRIDPGQAQQAYPALSGFVVRVDGQEVARCASDGVCPVLSAPNGERRVYEVWAVNAVGESRASVRTTAWAYDPPDTPTGLSATPVPAGDEGGRVSITIGRVDAASTGWLEITSPAGETQRVDVAAGDTSVTVPNYRVGSNAASLITVTPHARFEVPEGLGGTTTGGPATVRGNGIGAPQSLNLTLSSESIGSGQSRISASGSANRNGDGAELRYSFANVSAGQACGTTSTTSTAAFTVESGREYTIRVCVETWFQGTRFGRAQTEQTVRAVQSQTPPGGFTFVVASQPTVEPAAQRAFWTIQQQPTSTESAPLFNEPRFSKQLPISTIGSDPDIDARYCHTIWNQCGNWADVVPAAGRAPYQLRADWQLVRCEGNTLLQADGTVTNGDGTVTADVTSGAIVYYDENGQALTATDGIVPATAIRVEGIPITVSIGQWQLNDATATLGGPCTPAPVIEEPGGETTP